MTTVTLTLTEFLLARIAEDEAWSAEHRHFGDGTAPEWVPPFWTRVLAECEAKRRIIEIHEGGGGWSCLQCQPRDYTDNWSFVPSVLPCQTLYALAAVYSDHPDYREEWRP